jgi:flagellar biosynthesis protein FlhG
MNWGQAKKLLRLAANRRAASVEGAAAEARSFVGPLRPASARDRDAGVDSTGPTPSPAEPPRGAPVPDPARANGIEARVGARGEAEAAGPAAPAARLEVAPRAASLCIASGKGGTGKSVVTASLGSLLAIRGRTLIVDADMGVGNAHILQGVSPELSFVDVAEGRNSVTEIVQGCRDGLDLLCAGSGVSRMAGLSSYEMHLIACGLEKLEQDYEYLVVDSAAGVSDQTIAFAAACDCTLVVTTPDLTAMTDAYAFLKVLYAKDPAAKALLVVNRVEAADEGQHAAERICSVSDRFLGHGPTWLGSLPDDTAVRHAGNHRSPVVVASPEADVSGALRRLCVRVVAEVARERENRPARTPERTRGMGLRLVEACGYSSKFVSR